MSKFEEEPPPHPFPLEATRERPERPKKKPNGEAPPAVTLGESAFALLEADIPPPVRLCDPWATEGVCIIAGRPKLGKTTLMRQLLAAASTGAEFLDSRFMTEYPSTFLSLEEGRLLTREKFKMAKFSEQATESIDIHYEWPRGVFGVERLDQYLTQFTDRKIVVIDSLTRFREIPDSKLAVFQADYLAMSMLHDVAKKHRGVCVFVIHHTRKMRSEDPIDDISGSYGLTAACDSWAVLRHSGQAVTLSAGGRLWTRNDSMYTLKRGDQRWEMLGVHLDLSDEQKQTYQFIKDSGTSGLSGKELGDKLGITQPSAYQRIDILLEKGFVTKRFGRAYAK